MIGASCQLYKLLGLMVLWCRWRTLANCSVFAIRVVASFEVEKHLAPLLSKNSKEAVKLELPIEGWCLECDRWRGTWKRWRTQSCRHKDHHIKVTMSCGMKCNSDWFLKAGESCLCSSFFVFLPSTLARTP